jgi:hypothetical protein
MTLQTVVRPSPDQVSCDLQDEIAILNVKTGASYSLDPVGSLVWKLISERPRAVAALCDELLARFDVDAERCHADTLDLLNKLAGEGLIEFDEAGGATGLAGRGRA